MSMNDYLIREYSTPNDATLQYELWLAASESLPRAWRSSLQNVRHQLKHAQRYPKCRLYAEHQSGKLLGYIGTHPPFEWTTSQEDQPTKSLGWAIPYGFPWTHPQNSELEVALYDAMLRATPEQYAEFQRDIYVQRFRASWTRHLAFMEQRGWRLHKRIPILGRSADTDEESRPKLTLVQRDDLSLVSSISQQDEVIAKQLTLAELQQHYDGGWIASETFWRLGEDGVFAIESRASWAEVTLLLAKPDAWGQTLQAAVAQAAALGAAEVYFTVEAHESRLLNLLETHSFREVDASVYYLRDAD